MSFQIFVFIPQAALPMPDNPRDWGKWARECGKKILFEEPLGSDGMVYAFWSSAAERLGLPLLSSLYPDGLHLETPQQFAALEAELDQLEAYWHEHLLEELARDVDVPDGYQENLDGRLRHFRRAARQAGEMKAILFVKQSL